MGIFFAGLFTVGQFSFWGNYLPRVYPIHLRGTGESFAANIGGRMIGTSFALVASLLSTVMPGRQGAASGKRRGEDGDGRDGDRHGRVPGQLDFVLLPARAAAENLPE